MDVGVESACGDDEAFAGESFSAGARVETGGDTAHGLRAAGLADGADFAVFDADVRLVDAGVVHDEGVGDDGIRRFNVELHGALAHAVAE